jgi:transposase InsO family protein
MGNDGPEIPSLTSSNYAEWRVRIVDRLINKEVDEYIEEGVRMATETDRKKDRKALAQIRSHVSLQMLPYLEGVQTAREAWTRLATVNESTMQAKVLQLEEKFLQLKMQKTEDVTEYCARARRIQLELASVGQKVDDQRLIRRVLMGLPKAYSGVRDIVLFQNNIDVDRVVAQLKVAEESMGRKTEEESTALAAAEKKKGKHQKKKIICFKCGKPGHMKRNCPESANSRSDAVALSIVTSEDMAKEDMTWVIDSGATDHILRDVEFAHNVRKIDKCVLMGSGQQVKARRIGQVEMSVQVGSKWIDLFLSDVLIIPEAPYNLLSVTTMMKKGASVVCSNSDIKLYVPDRGHIGTAPVVDGLAMLKCVSAKRGASESAVLTTSNKRSSAFDRAKLWHYRLGHVSMGAMRSMQKDHMVVGWENEPEFVGESTVCDVCISSKQAASPFLPSQSRAQAPLDLVHTDLMGPFTPMTAGRSQYLLTAMDDYSGFAAVTPLQHKSDASAALKQTILLWERQLEKKVKCVRSDRGGEFIAFDTFCVDVGIRREKSVAYCPSSNGRAERLNRTLTERVRGMLLSSDVPKKYWGDAFATATVIYNLCPKSGQKATSFELFYGRKPDISRLRVFGCTVYSLINSKERKKLDARSERGRLIGYEEGTKGWKILLDDGRVVVRRHCYFDETRIVTKPRRITSYESSDEDEVEEDKKENNTDSAGDTESEGTAPELQDITPAKRSQPPLTRAAARQRCAMMALEESIQDVPATFDEMQKRPDAPQWQQATDDEIQTLQQLGVFEVVKRPSGVKPLTSKWVFALKRNKDGIVQRYRARLVARGHKQRYGIDYDEVFAPVAKPETTRLLLAYAASHDLEIEQIDVKTAFLYGDLHEEIYMEQPEGYDFGGGMVWKLHKSLYGLKQAARSWHETLRDKLVAAGFTIADADSSLFICSKPGTSTYLLIYVDDGLIVGEKSEVQLVIAVLEQHFKLRKLGDVEYFLGSEVIRDREKKTIIITQRKYAKSIVEMAGQADAKVRSTPVDANMRLSKEGDDLMKDNSKYAEILGMLMYLSNGSRPDLSYSVSVLARFMATPREEHWRVLIGVVRYVKGTMNYGIKFDGKALGELVGYSDADFGGDPDKRRSTTGYVFTIAGGAISWASKLQPTVAASTTEAEYMAAAHATKEALWLKKLMISFGFGSQKIPIQMHSDNQAAIAVMKNPTSHQRVKHIDIQHHFVRDRVQRGEVKFDYVDSKLNVADMLTKAVSKGQLEKLIPCVGLVNVILIGTQQ